MFIFTLLFADIAINKGNNLQGEFVKMYGGCTLLPTIFGGIFFSKYFPYIYDWAKTPPMGPLSGPKEGP